MDRVTMFLTQMGAVLSECVEQIAELTELGFVPTKHEQKLGELQRKLERAPEIQVTEERARELFLKSAELQSALTAEEYRYYISAATEADMWTRAKSVDPELRPEIRRRIREYQGARIPRANLITLRKAHAVAEEWLSWAEKETTSLISLRFEQRFQCRLPTKDREDQFAQAS